MTSAEVHGGRVGREAVPAPGVPGDRPYGDDVRGVVGLAIVDDLSAPTRVLAARRSDVPAGAPAWELPGGKVEPGESWEEAAHREIAEELGVRVRLGGFVPGPSYGGLWPLTPRLVMGVWLACGEPGEPEPAALEHSELRWVSWARAVDLDWLPGDLPVVRTLARRQES